MDVAGKLLDGSIPAGARAIRWLDDGDPRGAEVLSTIFHRTGQAHIIGVTGPPGAGKSTLTNALITEQRRRGRRVGVVAIDPSSPFTGGAILGDRVRMSGHSLDPDVFIRSIGSRGQAGGLSRSTHDACLVLDAMGYNVVFVETVGVGQDEIDVAALAHTTIILGVPGLGDEIQAVKAGLMEIGDVLVINKADREGFDAAFRQFELMLKLRVGGSADETSNWSPPLLRAVSTTGEGIGDIVDATDRHLSALKRSGEFGRHSGRRERDQALRLLQASLMDLLLEQADGSVLAALEARRLDPYTAARQLLRTLQEPKTP